MVTIRIAAALFLLTLSASTLAFWGFWPGSGWNDGYNRGYGGIGTEHYRGGSGDGGADISMDFTAWMKFDGAGNSSGYGRGDTWGRGYQGYARPGYGMPPPAWGPYPGAYPPAPYGFYPGFYPQATDVYAE